ncbi:MAG: XdhC family protein, partial [Candidatus Angelobacter sp.]
VLNKIHLDKYADLKNSENVVDSLRKINQQSLWSKKEEFRKKNECQIWEVKTELEKEGIAADKLARVYAPVGIDIGAVTPEEIAVAIVAELIAIRRHSVTPLPHMKSAKAAEILKQL